jgi:hypothetical protein
MTNTDGRLTLLDPTLAAGKSTTLSPRLSTLSGKTIGVIWNGRPPGDVLFDHMYEVLQAKYDVRRGPFIAKPYLGNVAPPEAFEELASTCDAVVTGVGD